MRNLALFLNLALSKIRDHEFSLGEVWRYTRASMSYAGALPPIWCDGNLLVDGCYTNNVPGTDLREMQWLNYFSKKIVQGRHFCKDFRTFFWVYVFCFVLFIFTRKWENYVSLFSLVGALKREPIFCAIQDTASIVFVAISDKVLQ